MSKSFGPKGLKLNIHAPGTGAALIVLAFTQVPVAIKAAAELACIGEVSNKLWRQTKTHKGINVSAIRQCNGHD
mgnify:CR=1 FL=1